MARQALDKRELERRASEAPFRRDNEDPAAFQQRQIEYTRQLLEQAGRLPTPDDIPPGDDMPRPETPGTSAGQGGRRRMQRN